MIELPIHSYDYAKKFGEIINEELRKLKLPGIIEVYESEGRCSLYYRYSGGSFKLKYSSSSDSTQGSVKHYTSDDTLNQIKNIINNGEGLMRFS